MTTVEGARAGDRRHARGRAGGGGRLGGRRGRGRGRRRGLDRLAGQAVDPGGDHLGAGAEPDPVAQATLRIDQERVGRVGHRVAGGRGGLDLRVRDAPRAGRGPDLVVGPGEADEAGLVVADVLLHGRRVVAGRVDGDEDDADLPVDELEGVADVGERRRADVGAVGVAEEDEDRLAAQGAEVERPAVLVGEAERRRRGGRDDGGVAIEALGGRRDRPDVAALVAGRHGLRRHAGPGERPDADADERREAEGEHGEQGEAGRRDGARGRGHDRPSVRSRRIPGGGPLARPRGAVGHRCRGVSSPAPRR